MSSLKKVDWVFSDINSVFEGEATGLVSSTVLDYKSYEAGISDTSSLNVAQNSIFEGAGTSMVSSTVFDI